MGSAPDEPWTPLISTLKVCPRSTLTNFESATLSCSQPLHLQLEGYWVADGLITLIPKERLSRAWRGGLEIDLGGPAEVVAALILPGSKDRNEWGALAIRQFMSKGTLRWARHDVAIAHL